MIFYIFSILYARRIFCHIFNLPKPFVVTPLLIDYSEYDKQYRKGISGKLFQFFSADQIEYLKTISRWMKGQKKLRIILYMFKGQQKAYKKDHKKSQQFFSLIQKWNTGNWCDPIH